tara:strand:+ start:10522 stop:11577 length:1056 start_codon:yes stop_codon:yes gene_type:complete
MTAPRVFVTNFNKNFTGVSATAAGVVAEQKMNLNLRLVGVSLPNCPTPISKREAVAMCRVRPDGLPFSIWHVRRNTEMRVAIWVRDVLKRPIKIVFTSAAKRRHSAYPRWLISKMDALIATTPEAATYVANVWSVVPHGVATDRFVTVKDRAKSWASLGYGGAFGVACVGRIRPEKGTDTFVDALLKVLPQHPGMIALIVGRAAPEHQAFERTLRDKISNAGLADRLLFVGEISAEEMPTLMASISLLVALPRYEGYGMTPLEAMSCGTPFVGSRTGYFDAFSDCGRNGTVVALGDDLGAVNAINNWVATGVTNSVARSLRAFTEKHYSVVREAAEIQAVYQRLWDGEKQP